VRRTLQQHDASLRFHRSYARLTSVHDCLAGMIAPTSGDAVINGMSIRDQMGRIRQSLGVCPQFDILWPNITVAEHLQLYAAIKGYRGGAETEQAVTAAARNVGVHLCNHRSCLHLSEKKCNRRSTRLHPFPFQLQPVRSSGVPVCGGILGQASHAAPVMAC